MNDNPAKRVWVVARVDEGRVMTADVFDDNDDAQNFAGELSVDTNNLSGQFQVLDSTLHCGHPRSEQGIDPNKFAKERLEGIYDGLAFDSADGADTKAAGRYIAAHKEELLEECARLIRKHIDSTLREKGLLKK